MKKTISNVNPWTFLDEYRGKVFSGEWPTLPEMFKITASRYPERPCFTVFEPERVSLNYTEAMAKIASVSRWLHSRGIGKDDKVAVTGKNIPEWTIAYLAVLFAGGTVVPIDYQLKQEELDLLLKTSRAKILFVDEEKHEAYNKKAGGSDVSYAEVVSLKKGIGNYIYDLDGNDFTPPAITEEDTAAILFTSGTTGNPKGVMLSHRNFVSDCYLCQGLCTMYPTDVFYALLPLHHAYTMLAVFFVTISVGAELVFGKKMIVKAILSELKEGKVTMFLGVPMLFNKLLSGILRGIREKGIVVYAIINFLMIISGIIKKITGINLGKNIFGAVLKKASLNNIRICISGGGPLAPSVFRKYNQLGLDFVQGYGLTEASPVTNFNPIEHYKETSVGKVIPGVDMKILNSGERGIGEVVVKGSMVMQGYFEMPEETAASFTEDGYLKTGDLGYLDSENYLYLTGRAKNLIVTEGGKNVYPEEIENEFQLFEEIEQILIRGFVLDKKLKTESIEALIYPNREFFNRSGENSKEQITARMEAIVSEVNKRLLSYQKIERTTLLDEPLEMTTTKKIKRNQGT
ncbi:MAG: AMP-binding protein [Spirochaetaceae bacterium]|nr:AMP-binding protein [Spirochaetaceae bacterium]